MVGLIVDVGDTFTIGDREFRCVEGSCVGCAFLEGKGYTCLMPLLNCKVGEDGRSEDVKFVEVFPVPKIGDVFKVGDIKVKCMEAEKFCECTGCDLQDINCKEYVNCDLGQIFKKVEE